MFPSEYKNAYGGLFLLREMEVEIDDYYQKYFNRYMTDQEAADSYSRLMVSSFIDVVRHDFPECFTK